MANIMLTDSCNLKCPYCFANEFVNKKLNEISTENFCKALDFILSDKNEYSVGLIGGEPLLHTNFQELASIAMNEHRIKVVSLYTNGILLNKVFNLFESKKLRALVNCNSYNDVGNVAFERLKSNLDELIFNRKKRNQIILGINIYKPTLDYSYMIELLRRYDYDKVRVSIAVPNVNLHNNSYKYFEEMKPIVKRFVGDLLANKIVPYFDCNKMPLCNITEDDKNYIFDIYSKNITKKITGYNDLFSPDVRCTPVIDIMQDLTAVRCFGLSQYTKQDIRQYKGITELKKYYDRIIDSLACNVISGEECLKCHLRNVNKCYGGCLAFKIEKIKRVQTIIEEYNVLSLK